MNKLTIIKNFIICLMMTLSFTLLIVYMKLTIAEFLILGFIFLFTVLLSYFFVTLPSRLWYKRLIIEKFRDKYLNLSFDAYDSELNRHIITANAKSIDYYITDSQDPIFKAIIDDKINFFFKADLFSKSISLCDRFGNIYKYNDIQISRNTEKIRFLYQDIEEFRKRIPDFSKVEKSNKWTIDPDSFEARVI